MTVGSPAKSNISSSTQRPTIGDPVGKNDPAHQASTWGENCDHGTWLTNRQHTGDTAKTELHGLKGENAIDTAVCEGKKV